MEFPELKPGDRITTQIDPFGRKKPSEHDAFRRTYTVKEVNDKQCKVRGCDEWLDRMWIKEIVGNEPDWTPELETKIMAQLQASVLWYDRLHFCGCGCPGEMLLFIRDVLVTMARSSRGNSLNTEDRNPCGLPGEPTSWEEERENLKKLLGVDENWDNDKLYWMTLYALDAAGLTEHGGGVGGSWLSGDGEFFVEHLLKLTDEDILEALDDDDFRITELRSLTQAESNAWERKCYNQALMDLLTKMFKAEPNVPIDLTQQEFQIVKTLVPTRA